MESYCRLSPSEDSAQDGDTRQVERDVPPPTQPVQNISSTIEGISLSGVTVHGNVSHTHVENHYPVNHQNRAYRENEREKWSSLIAFYGAEDSWLFPIPGEQKIKFEPEKYFVQMVMDILKRDGDERLVEGKSCQLSELFNTLVEGEERPMRILIRADAGYGKSTLCTKLAYDWAKGIQTFDCFPCGSTLVLKYRLRELREGQDLEQELVKFLHYYAERRRTPLSTTEDTIEEYGNRLILVLDGFDELSPNNQMQVQRILQLGDRNHQSIFRSASIIVTSRPCQMEFTFLILFHKHFRITGLNLQNRNELISKFFKNDEEQELAFKYDNVFDDKSSPLYILLVCWSLSQGTDQLFRNQIELINNCARLMARRCNVRNGFGYDEDQIEDLLFLLGKMFLNVQDHGTIIDADSAEEDLGTYYQFAIMSGILISVRTEQTDEDEMLESVHKTFQESLAAYHVEKTWSSLTNDTERRKYYKRYITILNFDVNIHAESQLITYGGQMADLYYTFKREVSSQNSSLHVCYQRDREHCPECAQDQRIPVINATLWPKFVEDWSTILLTLANMVTEFPEYGKLRNQLYELEFMFDRGFPSHCLCLQIFDKSYNVPQISTPRQNIISKQAGTFAKIRGLAGQDDKMLQDEAPIKSDESACSSKTHAALPITVYTSEDGIASRTKEIVNNFLKQYLADVEGNPGLVVAVEGDKVLQGEARIKSDEAACSSKTHVALPITVYTSEDGIASRTKEIVTDLLKQDLANVEGDYIYTHNFLRDDNNSDCTSRTPTASPITVYGREPWLGSRTRIIKVLVNQQQAFSVLDLNKYLLGVTKLATNLFPSVSRAESLEDCLNMWSGFFSQVNDENKCCNVMIKIGNSRGNMWETDELFVTEQTQEGWLECNQLYINIYNH